MLLPLQLNLLPLAQVSWAQTQPITPVTLALDVETALPLAPVSAAQATVSWAITLPGSQSGSVVMAVDVETAYALAAVGATTATITWAQTLLPTAAVVDPRVRGTWSPALLARWLVLDAGAVVALDVETAYPLAGVVDGGIPVTLALDVETAYPRPAAINTVTLALDVETAYALAAFARPQLAAALVLAPAERRIFRPAPELRVWRAPDEDRTWRPKQ